MSLLLLLLTHKHFTAAIPLASLTSRDDDPASTMTQQEETRTISSIVISCLFTLCACTWFCIRPDVPSPHDSKIRALRTRLNVVFWVLLSPELVLFWAFRQWYEAGKIAKEYKDRGWTRTHALTLVMGAFILYKDGQPIQTISIQLFRVLLRAGAIDFPSITKAEIRDRGKMHPILLFIVLLQSLWFIIQFIARLVKGLPPIQLELVTLAFMVMNGFILIFWWCKPLGIYQAFRIDTRFDLRRVHAEPGLRTIKDDYKRENKLSKPIKDIFLTEWEPLPSSNSLIGRFIRAIFRFIFVWPFKALYSDVGRLAISIQSASIPEGALRVPLFYAPDTTDFLQFALLPALFFGTIFGAVHCLFWSMGHFPTEMARFLWRISSITAAGFSALSLILLVLILATQLWNQVATNRFVNLIANFFVYIGICLVMLNFLLYVVARLGLLVLCFVALHGLPKEALGVVPWTNYIPHFS